MKMKIELEIKLNNHEKGKYEPTGEFRTPENGEFFYYAGEICQADAMSTTEDMPIFKRKRWRAEVGAAYYFVTDVLDVTDTEEEITETDNDRYQAGNYFRFKADAIEAAVTFRTALETIPRG